MTENSPQPPGCETSLHLQVTVDWGKRCWQMSREGCLARCYRPAGVRHTQQVSVEIQIFISCPAKCALKFFDALRLQGLGSRRAWLEVSNDGRVQWNKNLIRIGKKPQTFKWHSLLAFSCLLPAKNYIFYMPRNLLKDNFTWWEFRHNLVQWFSNFSIYQKSQTGSC